MRHHLYLMTSDAPAPAGDGDTRSWFFFYKWNADGELYVPQRMPFLDVAAGDMVWFVMDGCVLGGAPVIRVEEEMRHQEIWYAGDAVRAFSVPMPVQEDYLEAREVPAPVADPWLDLVAPLSRPLSSSS